MIELVFDCDDFYVVVVDWGVDDYSDIGYGFGMVGFVLYGDLIVFLVDVLWFVLLYWLEFVKIFLLDGFELNDLFFYGVIVILVVLLLEILVFECLRVFCVVIINENCFGVELMGWSVVFD